MSDTQESKNPIPAGTVTSYQDNAKTRKSRRLSKYDGAMIEFDRIWAPYGGPSEADIFREFGITREDFVGRVSTIRQQRQTAYPP
ncbi:hypothetical protein [Rhodococcus sp. NPDC057529]|uniref:hypothetical protein n=1 Tax=Rhodococcus sp. NPDC057529 TaxID=3346158 RepID=UPI003672B35F